MGALPHGRAADTLRLLNNYLIHKNERVIARAWVPRWYLAEIVCVNSNVSSANRCDRLHIITYLWLHICRRDVSLNIGNASKIHTVRRHFKLNMRRHPYPRSCHLQKPAADLFDLSLFLQIDRRNKILQALITLPFAARKIYRTANTVDQTLVTAAGVLTVVLRIDLNRPDVR